MIWNLKTKSLIIASVSAAFATWTTCDAGLFDNLFHKKNRCELPRRVPARDCTFGYFPTNWRPWDTCCDQPENAPSNLSFIHKSLNRLARRSSMRWQGRSC
ncbi:MAG: hypothetical protein O3C17_15630, partial [Planctomycetota bacterium]|nr:hypothetical protein [Planctomycetota bacterium]